MIGAPADVARAQGNEPVNEASTSTAARRLSVQVVDEATGKPAAGVLVAFGSEPVPATTVAQWKLESWGAIEKLAKTAGGGKPDTETDTGRILSEAGVVSVGVTGADGVCEVKIPLTGRADAVPVLQATVLGQGVFPISMKLTPDTQGPGRKPLKKLPAGVVLFTPMYADASGVGTKVDYMGLVMPGVSDEVRKQYEGDRFAQGKCVVGQATALMVPADVPMRLRLVGPGAFYLSDVMTAKPGQALSVGGALIVKAAVRWLPVKDDLGTPLAGTGIYVVKPGGVYEPLGWTNAGGMIPFSHAGKDRVTLALKAPDGQFVSAQVPEPVVGKPLQEVRFGFVGARAPGVNAASGEQAEEEDSLARYRAIGRIKLTDALGRPMPGDTKVTTGGKTVAVSGDGTINAMSLGQFYDGWVEVSHAAYGRVRFKELERVASAKMVLPLIAEGAAEAKNGMWGKVIEDNGKPVANVPVEVWSPEGSSYSGAAYEVMTDEKGVFRAYPVPHPDELAKTGIQPLIVGAFIALRVETQDRWLMQFEEYLKPGEQTITLHRAKREFLVTIKDMPNKDTHPYVRGSVIDPAKKVRLTQWRGIKASGEKVPMIEATYTLYVNGVPYEPLKVTAESPSELVFEPVQKIKCVGKIVDGETGNPMPGVLVFTMPYLRDATALARVPSSAWDALGKLTNPVDAAKDVPKVFLDAVRPDGCVLTDANGDFAVMAKPMRQGIIGALAKGYMPSMRKVDLSRKSSDGVVKARPIEMVPSATAVLEPEIKPAEREDMRAQQLGLFFNLHTPTKWSARYQMEMYSSPLMMLPERIYQGRVEVLVPANVPVNFYLTGLVDYSMSYIPMDSPVRWSSTETLTFKPGERIEVKLNRKELVKVKVRMVMADGTPINGYPMGLMVADAPEIWTRSAPTDGEGIATLYCPAGQKVKMGMGDVTPGAAKVVVSYDVPEKESDEVFTVTVKDDALIYVVGNKNRVTELKKARAAKSK